MSLKFLCSRQFAAAVVVLLGVAPDRATTVHAQAPSVLVIASGLDNPRGLAFGTDGALYVAEAGRGGTSTLCAVDPGTGANRCYGPTGAITRITRQGVQQRVVTGLPSIAPVGGDLATGPVDIDFAMGRVWVLIGFAGNPAVRAPLEAAGIRLGSLVRVLPTGQWDYVVDVSAYEAAANPDGLAVDTNPYGLRVLSDRAVVADAGANALLQISLNAVISTLAVFPTRTLPSGVVIQSVPTSVTQGADGNFYVGGLHGGTVSERRGTGVRAIRRRNTRSRGRGLYQHHRHRVWTGRRRLRARTRRRRHSSHRSARATTAV